MDGSKCLHELRINEDALYFPFPPLEPQRAVASHVLRACEEGGIALLQSPTGSGKSLALLCSVLAWQRRRAQHGIAPQVVYGVRTHAQIKQVVGELRKCGYRPSMAVIGSRDQLCGNGLVKSRAQRLQVPLSLACRQSCRAAHGSAGCELYEGLGQASYAQRVHERCGAGQVWDVEDLISCSSGLGCPYYTAHILAGDADLVFCPQNYILDPSVSQCRSHHRERWSLHGRVVVLDEAHNLEACCREAGSLEVSQQELQQMSRVLRLMPLRHPALRFERRNCQQAAAELERVPLQLCAFLQRPGGHSELDGHLQHLWGLQSEQVLRRDLGGLATKNMEDLTLEAIDRLLQAKLQDDEASMEDAELLATLEKLKALIFKLRLAMQHPDSYVVGISPGSGAPEKLCVWLMSPGVLFEVFAAQAHAVLLASGTLTPLSALKAELKDSKSMQRALPALEARHVVHPWQLCAAVLPSFNSQPLVSTYGSWQSEEFVQTLGNCVLQLVSCIPGGVLCFMPSYQSLELAQLFWRRSDIWSKLEEAKTVVLEPRNSYELAEASQRYTAGAQDGRGAICLAVYRGKMSEGLDFVDELCRAVICIGVPYPQMKDPVVFAKRSWNDQRSREGYLSGDQWYELQAHRAVNQALGRLLRHSNDFGAMILLDARWAKHGVRSRNLRQRLDPWIQRHLQDWPSNPKNDICSRLRQHFADAKRHLEPPAAMPVQPQPVREAPKRRFLDLLLEESRRLENARAVAAR